MSHYEGPPAFVCPGGREIGDQGHHARRDDHLLQACGGQGGQDDLHRYAMLVGVVPVGEPDQAQVAVSALDERADRGLVKTAHDEIALANRQRAAELRLRAGADRSAVTERGTAPFAGYCGAAACAGSGRYVAVG